MMGQRFDDFHSILISSFEFFEVGFSCEHTVKDHPEYADVSVYLILNIHIGVCR